MTCDGLQLRPLDIAILAAADCLPVMAVLELNVDLVIREMLDTSRSRLVAIRSLVLQLSVVIIDELANLRLLDAAVLGNQDSCVPVN